MNKYVEYVPCTLISITDQTDGWFEAHATYQGNKPLTSLINAPSMQIAQTYVDQSNVYDKEVGNLLSKSSTQIIDSISPISLSELGAKLTKGSSYGGVISTEDGRNASVGPLTPNMRNFLQQAARSPSPAA